MRQSASVLKDLRQWDLSDTADMLLALIQEEEEERGRAKALKQRHVRMDSSINERHRWIRQQERAMPPPAMQMKRVSDGAAHPSDVLEREAKAWGHRWQKKHPADSYGEELKQQARALEERYGPSAQPIDAESEVLTAAALHSAARRIAAKAPGSD